MKRAIVAMAIAVLAIGCSRATAIAKGDASPAAKRVVSLSPSTTETMFAIGAGAQLVGRSRYCDYPAEARALPEVGGYVDPNLEAILALHPDLVIGARGPAGTKYTDALAGHGVATFFPPTESFAAIDAMMREVGSRTGHASDAGRVVDAIDARVAAIASAVSHVPKARVLLVFGTAPIVVAGPGGFADEMVARAGGENVVKDGGAYPTLGVERVIALDPDVILDAMMGEAHIAKDAAGWRDVSAVKRARVIAIDDEAVLRPGPRVAGGLATIARALHPDVAVP